MNVFKPIAKIEVTDLDIPVLNIPFIGQIRQATISMIEEAVNTSLAMRLVGVTVPNWYPIDTTLDAMAIATPHPDHR